MTKLRRIIAHCLRFIDVKVRKLKIKGIISVHEIRRANATIIKVVQRETFYKEIKSLNAQERINGKLSPLTPFLDSEGTLRVGGRLRNSDLAYSEKHPILLP